MSFEHVASFAQILSSVAVLVTLVYLAIQTKQTHNALVASSRQGTMAADVEMLSASFSGLDVTSLMLKDPEQLTEGERFTVGTWCAAYVRVREFAWFQYKAGIMDEATWRSYIGPTKRILSLPNLNKWWVEFSQEVDPGFRAHLDNELGK